MSDRLTATLRVSGQTYEVVHPRVIDAATAAPQLPPRHRRSFQRFGIDNFMKVDIAPSSA
jgi:hypothetical protein